MLLSVRDADVLRLAYWCQYMRPKDLYDVSSKVEVKDLIDKGLLKLHKKSGALVVTGKGILLLGYMLDGQLPEVSQSYHAAAIERRLRLSALSLTAYRAGLDLFICTTEELTEEGKMFLTVHGRSRGQNPWGSTRIAAIAHMGELVCGFHFIYPEIGMLALTDELTAFNNNTAAIENRRRALIFCGESYQGIVEELDRQSYPDKSTKLVPYKEAYRSLNLPIHFVSCDAVGATQMKIMAVPGYREKLTKAALMSQYQPAPEDVPEWDAIFSGCPLVLAVDMDLRRIDAGIAKAKERGFSRVAILALQEQASAILYSRYREDCFVGIYCLNTATLNSFAGRSMELYTPPPAQYLTAKGGVVDTPLIQAIRKAGR